MYQRVNSIHSAEYDLGSAFICPLQVVLEEPREKLDCFAISTSVKSGPPPFTIASVALRPRDRYGGVGERRTNIYDDHERAKVQRDGLVALREVFDKIFKTE